MAWTAPRTWVTAETVTAALMNTHIRDNLLETAPAKAGATDQLFVSTGANALTTIAAPNNINEVLLGAAPPNWAAFKDGLIQFNDDNDDANLTMSTSWVNTAAQITFNPAWDLWDVSAFGSCSIIGGGSGNAFQTRLHDGTTAGAANGMQTGSATTSCTASAALTLTGFSASVTFSVQRIQTDAGTLGTFDSASIFGVAIRTG